MKDTSKLKFSLAIPKEKKEKRGSVSSPPKSELTNGIMRLVDGTFKCFIESDTDEILAINFTPESYDNKGKTTVFVNYNDTVLIYRRTQQEANHFPGIDTQYHTLEDGWECDGIIINRDGKKLFNLHEIIKPEKIIK